MDGKEAIINKILGDAKIKAEETVKLAESEISEKKQAVISETEKFIDNEKKQIENEAKGIVERKITVAELDVRKNLLKAKQGLIDDAFTIALDKLRSIGKTYYLRLVVKMINESADEFDEIVLSKDGVLKEEDLLKEKIFADKKLSIAKSRGDFNGGVKLIGKKSDKDLTFETLVKDLKEETTSKIASLIF